MTFLWNTHHVNHQDLRSEFLLTWVDDPASTPAQLDAPTQSDESAWAAARREFLLY